MTDETHQHIVDLLTHSSPEVRCKAAGSLARHQSGGLAGTTNLPATAALAAALHDPHRAVREAAVRTLHADGTEAIARVIDVEYIARAGKLEDWFQALLKARTKTHFFATKSRRHKASQR